MECKERAGCPSSGSRFPELYASGTYNEHRAQGNGIMEKRTKCNTGNIEDGLENRPQRVLHSFCRGRNLIFFQEGKYKEQSDQHFKTVVPL